MPRHLSTTTELIEQTTTRRADLEKSKNTTTTTTKKKKKKKRQGDRGHRDRKRIYRFSTLVPNTIPHAVMKTRKDWREIPLFIAPEKASLMEDEEEDEDRERESRRETSTTTLTPKIDFFYADVGWIHQNISYSRGGCDEIGRAHVRTPVTEKSRMPSSA